MNFSALLVHLILQPGLYYWQAPPAYQFDAKVLKIWQLVVTLPISNTLQLDMKKPMMEVPNFAKVARTWSVYHKYLF